MFDKYQYLVNILHMVPHMFDNNNKCITWASFPKTSQHSGKEKLRVKDMREQHNYVVELNLP